MADPWIKVRESLHTDPRVFTIASHLSKAPAAAAYVFQASARDLLGVTPTVTQDVLRDVTVSALLRVWIAARRHTSDGVFHKTDLSFIDNLSHVPGFGLAMQAAGYAVYDEQAQTVTLPNFLEHNSTTKGKEGGSHAERQRRYRERKKQSKGDENDTNEGVTRDVSRDASPSLSLSISLSGTSSASELEKLKKRINALSPAWTKAAHWGHEEERQLLEALPNLTALDSRDWDILSWFCRQAFDPRNGMTSRDELKLTTKRGQFVADLSSILERATKHWKQSGCPRLSGISSAPAKKLQEAPPADVVPTSEAGLLFRNLHEKGTSAP